MYEMESGLRKVRVGAVPSTVQVCMTCLDMDSKLFSMGKYNLEKTYENLTGHSLCNMGNLKQTLCVECTQILINFRRFRDKSLRAHNLMLDLVKKHQSVTKQHIKSIDRVKNQLVSNITKITLEPDRYNSYGLQHMDEYKDAKIDPLVDTENIIVKNEIKDESTSVNEDNDVDIKIEVDIDENDYNGDFLLPYDNDISDDNLMQDTKLMNHDQCKVVLRKISNFEVSQIQKQLKNQKLVHKCIKCFKNFLTEAELNVHRTIHSKPQRRPPPASTLARAATRVTHTDGLASTAERVRATSADCEPALATPLPAGLATTNEVKRHPTSSEADTFRNSTKRLEDDNNQLGDSKSSNNNNNKGTRTKSLAVRMYGDFREPEKVIQKEDEAIKKTQNNCNIFEGVKPFACDVCHYKSSRKFDIIRHMNFHTGEKPFACSICQHKFSQKCHLKSHMTRHTGEKPFACELCQYKCSQKSNLVSHMRRHTGEKPFTCNVCHYKSAQKYTLMNHMKRHTGEKPFACKICHHKFSWKYLLESHMKEAH